MRTAIHAMIGSLALSFVLAVPAAPAGEPLAPGAVEGAKAPAAAPAKEETLATVSRLTGSAERKRAGQDGFKALAVEAGLFRGDELRTGKNSALEMKLSDGALVTLGAGSTLVLREVRGSFKSDATLLDLDEGTVGAAVDKLGERQRFEISTPVAVCGVRGTRLMLRHTNPAGGRTEKNRGTSQLHVGTGLVSALARNPIFAGGKGLNVGKGQSLTITWDGFAGQPEKLNVRDLRKLLGGLPGWQPDPADPNLMRMLAESGDDGPDRARRPRGGGAYDRGGRGFSNAVGSAIFGRLGLADSGGRSGQGGSQGGGGASNPGAFSAGAGGGGAGTGTFNFASDPIQNVTVRPGQPTDQPPPPPVGT